MLLLLPPEGDGVVGAGVPLSRWRSCLCLLLCLLLVLVLVLVLVLGWHLLGLLEPLLLPWGLVGSAAA
jgi:hypothetical protein